MERRAARRDARACVGHAGDAGDSGSELAADRRRRARRSTRRNRCAPPPDVTNYPEPLYTADDAAAALAQFSGLITTGRPRRAGNARHPRDAGHILGSAIIEVDVEQPDGTSRRIIFSGDVGRPNTPIIRDPTTINDGADYVLMESTYGGREHEPEQEAIRLLAEAVRAVADHSGVLLIPSFAIGRTQEIVWVLDRLLTAGGSRIFRSISTPPWRARPRLYRRYPGYTTRRPRHCWPRATPLDYPGQISPILSSPAHRGAPRPM